MKILRSLMAPIVRDWDRVQVIVPLISLLIFYSWVIW